MSLADSLVGGVVEGKIAEGGSNDLCVSYDVLERYFRKCAIVVDDGEGKRGYQRKIDGLDHSGRQE